MARLPGHHVPGGHVVLAQDDGQPLLVGDVLQLRYHDPPRLLVQPLITPVRVQRLRSEEYFAIKWRTGEVSSFKSDLQPPGNPVMLSHPDGVRDSELELLIAPAS